MIKLKNNLKNSIIKILCYLISKKILVKLELFSTLLQGKGYGIGKIEHEIKSCIRLIKKGKVNIILDIGSNKGDYTETLLNYYKDANYYLFEPNNLNFRILKKKFKNKTNIKIINKAVSNINGKAKLYFEKLGSAEASLIERNKHTIKTYFKKSENIYSIRLDFFFKNKLKNKTIDYCKIDVEGLEFKVLEGLGKLIKQTKIIQFEISGATLESRIFFFDFWKFFIKNNFEI